MKLSAWHKRQGDTVEWYEQLFCGMGEPFDKVYMSKVFSFTPDYPYFVNAKKVHKGGSGYCIRLEDGKEIYDTEKDIILPPEIETIYPDYEIYYEKIPEVRNTAYGFLTRGCPRGCKFCHVGCKEGKKAYKAANLDTFWREQKNIVLLDPNITACKEWKPLFRQLIDSKAWIDFSQGLDIRLMTGEKARMIKRMKIKNIHFAWDRYQDKDNVIEKFKEFKEITGWDRRKLTVYVLTNFDTTIEQDLERIYILRDLGYWPYVMIYDKQHTKQTDTVRKIQRWVNARAVFETVRRFEDYQKKEGGRI